MDCPVNGFIFCRSKPKQKSVIANRKAADSWLKFAFGRAEDVDGF